LGYKTLINSPFKGTIVPLNYYQKNKKVLSVMLEINRSLYMDEATGQKNSNFNKEKKDIFNSIKSLNQTFKP
jgi:N-formylglutamate amidohydrolase